MDMPIWFHIGLPAHSFYHTKTMIFIAVISTIIGVVTFPIPWDTVAIVADETVRIAAASRNVRGCIPHYVQRWEKQSHDQHKHQHNDDNNNNNNNNNNNANYNNYHHNHNHNRNDNHKIVIQFLNMTKKNQQTLIYTWCKSIWHFWWLPFPIW